MGGPRSLRRLWPLAAFRLAAFRLALMLAGLGLALMLAGLGPVAPARAQGGDDKTYLEDLLERNLSGEGLEVTITGFRGALSSEATLERLTIADAAGVWLTLEGAQLVWSRAALLRGRLEVERLTARRIDVNRLPARDLGLSPARDEAAPFALPELPVSVFIGALGVEELHLGPSVLGEDLRLSLQGSARLEEGTGEVALALRRLDRPDAFRLEAGYSNATRMLRMDLDFDERAGGLVARRLAIPGTPALRLTLAGEGPIDDFEARLALSTDGVRRVSGQIRLEGGAGGAEELSFSTALSGDLRPLVAPDLHPFFGETATLLAEGRRGGDGRLTLDRLRLRSGAFTLTGALALAGDGWPERFELEGRIAGQGAIRLPLAGAATYLAGAELSARFDAAQGDGWQAELALRGLRRAGLRLDAARLAGEGRITRGALPGIEASLRMSVDGLTHADPSLARALGGALAGTARVTYRRGAPLEIGEISLVSGDASLTAQGRLGLLAEGLPAKGRAVLRAQDLARFAALAGRPLGGAVELRLDGAAGLRAPAFDGDIRLTGRDLRGAHPLADRLLEGDVVLEGRLALGGEQLHVERLRLEAPRLRLSASGPGPGAPITIDGRLSDLALIAPGVSGPVTLGGQLTPADGAVPGSLEVDLRLEGPGGSRARVAGTVADQGRRLALAIEGVAPLGLANGLIVPRSIEGPARFALRLEGAPRPAGLSGRIEIGPGRLVLPGLRLALSGLRGSVSLGGGRAEVDLVGDAGRGGRFRVTGPVTFAASYPAALAIAFERLGLSDGELYETSLQGQVTLEGPLLGGAMLRGAVALGPTEIRVPSGGMNAPGVIPEIRHLHESAAVRETRRRAGLVANPRGSVAAFPLDLTIVARDRVFVRGRGLDAELGGTMRLGGTSADVTASGAFELIRGRLDLLTRRLTLSEGRIDLRGPLDPYLRFVARTETETASVEVVLEGVASAPTVRFSSVPDMPQEEILAQLLFGHGFEGISPFQAAQLVSAVATLAGRGGGGLTDRLRRRLGLSDIDIRSTDRGTTAFSVGAYVSDRIYSEITVDSEGNNEINLNLDLSRSVIVKGRANSAGETGLGIFFEKDY